MMPLAIIALTVAGFGIGTSEFVIVGLLPEVAYDLNVSIPRAGYLVTAYALGVAIGAPVLAVLTARFPRKPTLIGLIGLFIFGNALCAVASGYYLLMAARIIAALCHGTFFGIAAVVGAQLVPENRRTQAIAWIFMGVSLANLLGVPLGTMLGQAFGWRSTFWAVSSIGILAIAAIAVFLPAKIAMRSSDFKAEFKALLNPDVVMPLAVSVLTSASLFTVFTYIAPLLEQVTMVPVHRVAGILVLLGVGLCAGSLVGGKLGDRNLTGSLLAAEFVLLAVLTAMRFTAPFVFPAVVNMFTWLVLAFALCPILQMLVVNQASEAPTLSSAFNQSGFNFGNAIGAWLGGVMLSNGVRLIDLPFGSAALVAAAIWLTLLIRRNLKRNAISV